MGNSVSVEQKPNANIYEQIGQRIRELRKARGLTQAQAAKLIDVSAQQYQKYEDAQSKCNLNYLVILADYYRVSLSSLITGAEEETLPALEVVTSEADLLARLVNSFVNLSTLDEKLRLVQLVEVMSDDSRK